MKASRMSTNRMSLMRARPLQRRNEPAFKSMCSLTILTPQGTGDMVFDGFGEPGTGGLGTVLPSKDRAVASAERVGHQDTRVLDYRDMKCLVAVDVCSLP